VRRGEVRTFLFGLVIALPACAGAAEVYAPVFMTGNDLLACCQSSNWQQRSQCVGYIKGVKDTMTLTRTLSGMEPCPPEHVVEKQIEDIVVKALIANPTQRDVAAPTLVIGAIADAWHCRR
jgi:hypothetical protein